MKTTAEIKADAERYCRALLVGYVEKGAQFIAALDEGECDLVVSFLMEAYCQGALEALQELEPRLRKTGS